MIQQIAAAQITQTIHALQTSRLFTVTNFAICMCRVHTSNKGNKVIVCVSLKLVRSQQSSQELMNVI